LLAGFMLCSGAAGGSDVYKWVAADGATHYSDAPPATDLASVEILEMAVATPARPAARNYQSVLDVANSIEASRLERERLRLEKKQLRLQEAQARQSIPARNDVDRVVGYYYLPGFHHGRKHPYGGGHSRPGRGSHPRDERPDLHSQVYTQQK